MDRAQLFPRLLDFQLDSVSAAVRAQTQHWKAMAAQLCYLPLRELDMTGAQQRIMRSSSL